MSFEPGTQVLIVIVSLLVTLALLFVVFALLRMIFLLFRKYGISRKKGENPAETGNPQTAPTDSDSHIDSTLLNEMERKWKHYIDLQFEKLHEQMIKLINDKIRNLPTPGETGTPETTEKGKSMKPPPGTQTDYKKGKEIEPDLYAGNAQTTCLRIYNAAITNPEEEREFRRQYKPIRVDVVNAMERKRDPDLEPEFKTDDRGDLFVVGLEDENDGGRTSFFVFPRFELKISDSNFSAGGIGDVFKCPGYDQQYVFGISRVISPAIFAREGQDHWNLISKGELELLREEYEDE